MRAEIVEGCNYESVVFFHWRLYDDNGVIAFGEHDFDTAKEARESLDKFIKDFSTHGVVVDETEPVKD